MGHVINPLSFRLYFSRFWNNNWYVTHNYSFFLLKDLQIHEYFFAFFFLNKRHRRFFYKKFIFDSVSIARIPNKIFITLNIFDFRLKTYVNNNNRSSSHRKDSSVPLLNSNYFINANHIHKKMRLRSTPMLARYMTKNFLIYANFPWFLKKYKSVYFRRAYSQGSKVRYLSYKYCRTYRKKFFLAYYLYIQSVSSRLMALNVLHMSLQEFFFKLLEKYNFFLNKIKDPLLLSGILNYSQKSLNISNRVRLLFINKTSIKTKLIKRSRQLSYSRLRLKQRNLKKYFFLSFNNLSVTKNLIIKYKNLLFLLKQRIDLFKLKGVKSCYLNNLYWRRDRLLSLIYFLRKKSRRMYKQFKASIFSLNRRLNKLTVLLNKVKNHKHRTALLAYKANLVFNLHYKLIFLKVYNNLFVLNSKFAVFNYLNLLDKFKLLRFNYRFAIYKQGLQKIQKNIVTKLMRFRIPNRFRRYYRQNRFGFIEKSQKFWKMSQINSLVKSSKSLNYKVKNFLNIFYRKVARFDLRYFGNSFNPQMIKFFSNYRQTAKLVRMHLDSLKMLEKRTYLLKRRTTNNENYKYFLEFLSLKRVYRFGDNTTSTKSIKTTLAFLINQLASKGHTKLRIRKYLKKRYVYLLLKKFINNKYGRRSIMKLKLFFFKQGLRPRRSKQLKFRRLIYTKKFRYQHLSPIQKIKSLGLRKWLMFKKRRISVWRRSLNTRAFFFNKIKKMRTGRRKLFRRYRRNNLRNSFIVNFFILNRRRGSRKLLNFDNSNFLFKKKWVRRYSNRLFNVPLIPKHNLKKFKLNLRNHFIKQNVLFSNIFRGKRPLKFRNFLSIGFLKNFKRFRNAFKSTWFSGFNKLNFKLTGFNSIQSFNRKQGLFFHRQSFKSNSMFFFKTFRQVLQKKILLKVMRPKFRILFRYKNHKLFVGSKFRKSVRNQLKFFINNNKRNKRKLFIKAQFKLFKEKNRQLFIKKKNDKLFIKKKFRFFVKKNHMFMVNNKNKLYQQNLCGYLKKVGRVFRVRKFKFIRNVNFRRFNLHLDSGIYKQMNLLNKDNLANLKNQYLKKVNFKRREKLYRVSRKIEKRLFIFKHKQLWQQKQNKSRNEYYGYGTYKDNGTAKAKNKYFLNSSGALLRRRYFWGNKRLKYLGLNYKRKNKRKRRRFLFNKMPFSFYLAYKRLKKKKIKIGSKNNLLRIRDKSLFITSNLKFTKHRYHALKNLYFLSLFKNIAVKKKIKKRTRRFRSIQSLFNLNKLKKPINSAPFSLISRNIFILKKKKKKFYTTVFLKSRRYFLIKKYLNLYSKRRERRLFRKSHTTKFIRPFGQFLVKKNKRKWLNRQIKSYNNFSLRHCRRFNFKFKFLKKIKTRRIRQKIVLRKFRKYRRPIFRFKILKLDNFLLAYDNIWGRQKKRKVLRVRLQRKMQIRWLSFHGLVNLTRRAYRRSILLQFFMLKSNSKFRLSWRRYRNNILRNKWYSFPGFRKPFYIFRTVTKLKYRTSIARVHSSLKFLKGFYKFSRFKFLISLLSHKSSYLNLLKFGYKLSNLKKKQKSFLSNQSVLKKNYFIHGLHHNKSMLTSVVRLINPLYSKFLLGGNLTTRLLWRDLYLNKSINKLKLIRKRKLFSLFLNKINFKNKVLLKKKNIEKNAIIIKKKKVLKNLRFTSNLLRRPLIKKRLIINLKVKVKRPKLKLKRPLNLYLKNKIRIQDKKKIQMPRHFEVLKRNRLYKKDIVVSKNVKFLKKKFRFFYKRQGWKISKSFKAKFFYGQGQNSNKILYKWLNKRLRLSPTAYNLLESMTLQLNKNRIRVYSFSSFINKTWVKIPLYFSKLPHLLIMSGSNFSNKKSIWYARQNVFSKKKNRMRVQFLKIKLKKKSQLIQSQIRLLCKLMKKNIRRKNIFIRKPIFLSKKKIFSVFKYLKLEYERLQNYRSYFHTSSNLLNVMTKFNFDKLVKYRAKFKRKLFKYNSKKGVNLFWKKRLYRTRKSKWLLYSLSTPFNKNIRFNFIKYSLISNMQIFSKSLKLQRYLNEFRLINKFNLNFKRLTHANIYSWNKFSYLLYKNVKVFSSIQTRKSKTLKNLFLKKKLHKLNIKTLNFYKVLKMLLFRNKYNYYFSVKSHTKNLKIFYYHLNYLFSKVTLRSNISKYYHSKWLRFFKKDFYPIIYKNNRIKIWNKNFRTRINNKFFIHNLQFGRYKKFLQLNKVLFVNRNIQLKQLVKRYRFRVLFRNLKRTFIFKTKHLKKTNKHFIIKNRIKWSKHKKQHNKRMLIKNRICLYNWIVKRKSNYLKFLSSNFILRKSAINKKKYASVNTQIFFYFNLDKYMKLRSNNLRIQHQIKKMRTFTWKNYLSFFNIKSIQLPSIKWRRFRIKKKKKLLVKRWSNLRIKNFFIKLKPKYMEKLSLKKMKKKSVKYSFKGKKQYKYTSRSYSDFGQRLPIGVNNSNPISQKHINASTTLSTDSSFNKNWRDVYQRSDRKQKPIGGFEEFRRSKLFPVKRHWNSSGKQKNRKWVRNKHKSLYYSFSTKKFYGKKLQKFLKKDSIISQKSFLQRKIFMQLSNFNILTNNLMNRKLFVSLKQKTRTSLMSKAQAFNMHSRKFYFVWSKASDIFFQNSKSRLFINFLRLRNSYHLKKNLYPKKIKFHFFFKKKNQNQNKRHHQFFLKNRVFTSLWKKNSFSSLFAYNINLFRDKNINKSSLFDVRFRFNNFRRFYKNIRSILRRRRNFISKLTHNFWNYVPKRRNIVVNSNIRLSNDQLLVNKNFFSKILNLLGYKHAFVQGFLFKFNSRLFIFIIKYLLIQKYRKKFKYFLNTSQIIKQSHNYLSFYTYINNLVLPVNSSISFDDFLLVRKLDLIRYSKYNSHAIMSFSPVQIKLNLFIIFFNIVLLYRKLLQRDKGNTRLLLIAFKFQKYLWARLKRQKHFDYLIRFKNLNNSKSYLLKNSIWKIQKLNRWRKLFWFKISRFLLSEERLFIRLNHHKPNIKKLRPFRLKLKVKLLGAAYYYLSFFLKWHLTRTFFKGNEGSLFLRFNILLEPTAFFVAKHICRNLRKGLKLTRIVNSIIYQMPKMYSNIISIQVKCVGRHTRKERASKDWFRKGSLRLSDIKSNLDYASVGVVLRYGYTNVKVWILKRTKRSSLPGISTAFI